MQADGGESRGLALQIWRVRRIAGTANIGAQRQPLAGRPTLQMGGTPVPSRPASVAQAAANQCQRFSSRRQSGVAAGANNISATRIVHVPTEHQCGRLESAQCKLLRLAQAAWLSVALSLFQAHTHSQTQQKRISWHQ